MFFPLNTNIYSWDASELVLFEIVFVEFLSLSFTLKGKVVIMLYKENNYRVYRESNYSRNVVGLAVLNDYNAIIISAQVCIFSVSPLGCKSSCKVLIKSWRNDSYQPKWDQKQVTDSSDKTKNEGGGFWLEKGKMFVWCSNLSCTYCFSHLFQAGGMEWPSPHDGKKLLQAARNGDLQEFKTLLEYLWCEFSGRCKCTLWRWPGTNTQ